MRPIAVPALSIYIGNPVLKNNYVGIYIYRMTKTCIQCSKCKGVGLVKKKWKCCSICKKYNLTICTICENKKMLGLYKECEQCFGRGEKWVYDESNNKGLNTNRDDIDKQ